LRICVKLAERSHAKTRRREEIFHSLCGFAPLREEMLNPKRESVHVNPR
jgi:hypothetical protein